MFVFAHPVRFLSCSQAKSSIDGALIKGVGEPNLQQRLRHVIPNKLLVRREGDSSNVIFCIRRCRFKHSKWRRVSMFRRLIRALSRLKSNEVGPTIPPLDDPLSGDNGNGCCVILVAATAAIVALLH
jgi:hypothetical protein